MNKIKILPSQLALVLAVAARLRLPGTARAVRILSRLIPAWRKVPVVGPDGNSFFINLSEGDFSWLLGGWRNEAVAAACRGIPKDGVALDIGANIGVITRSLAALVPYGAVHAFEPSPVTFMRLSDNCSSLRNTACHCFALGETNGSVAFSDEATSNGLRHIVNPIESGNILVHCERLDDWFHATGLMRLDFIKIDVEGFEEEILLPASALLSRFRPVILFEFSPSFSALRSRYKGEKMFPFLRSLGYVIHRFDDFGMIHPLEDNDYPNLSNDYLARFS
jgi:FkbM family methyltransferase